MINIADDIAFLRKVQVPNGVESIWLKNKNDMEKLTVSATLIQEILNKKPPIVLSNTFI